MFNLNAQFSWRVAITVDNNTINDNGALDYARKYWVRTSQSDTKGGTDGSTAEAVTTLNGLIASLPNADQTRAVIVGHGQPGEISTGDGNILSHFDRFIASFNQGDWGKEFSKLSRIDNLIFFGCNVGAGDDGADLLYRVAQTLVCSVQGYNGIVCVGENGPAYQPGGTWIVATPTHRPTPFSPLFRFQGRSEMDDIVIKSEKGMERLSAASIIRVTYQEPRGQSTWDAGFTLQGKEAEGLLQLIDFSHPNILSCEPLAIVTGKLTLAVKGYSHSPEVEREYIVYNDLLLGDRHFKDVYYDLAPSFKATVRILTHAKG